ncbi:MAG: hypothetical protein IJA32_08285 [Lachnospiraceae bacterium]|nr:hypothetical protein [Lachnospiraceae bacterium]
MTQLNQMEVQNLRHLINAHETISQKWSEYAKACDSQEVKDFLRNGAESAAKTKDAFMKYL